MALLALVALSRGLPLWLARPSEGEPDSALFTLGVWRWSRLGPHASRIYDRTFSSGYYAAAATLARIGHLQLPQITPLLDMTSWLAAIATAALVYALARRFVPPAAAWWSSVLFLFAPGVWQLGLEPHPQGLGIALALLAFYLCVLALDDAARRPSPWLLLAVSALAAALLVRADAVFLYPAFLAVVPLRQPRSSTARPCRSAAAIGWIAAVLVAATALAALVGAWLLGQNAGVTAQVGWRQIAGYLGGLSLFKQALPFVTGLGLATTLFALTGLWLAVVAFPSPPAPDFTHADLARDAAPGRVPAWAWPLFLCAWILPGAIFWLLVRGNNVRHVALCALPALWLAGWGWMRLAPRPGRRPRQWLAIAALAALLLDFFLPPPSSNITLYPSGDVPASFALLRRRERQMRQLAASLLAASGDASPAPVCYLGSTTSPYILLYTLEIADRQGLAWRLRRRGVVTTWRAAGRRLIFHDVYSSVESRDVRRSCGLAASLEFDARGRHLWFFGQEWRWLPGHRRWYAARAELPSAGQPSMR